MCIRDSIMAISREIRDYKYDDYNLFRLAKKIFKNLNGGLLKLSTNTTKLIDLLSSFFLKNAPARFHGEIFKIFAFKTRINFL